MIGALDYSKGKDRLLSRSKRTYSRLRRRSLPDKSVFVILSSEGRCSPALPALLNRFPGRRRQSRALLRIRTESYTARGCATSAASSFCSLYSPFSFVLPERPGLLVSGNEVNRRIRKGWSSVTKPVTPSRSCSSKVLVWRYSNGEVFVWRYNDGEIFVRRYSDSEVLVGRNNADCAFFCFKNFIFEFVWNDR